MKSLELNQKTIVITGADGFLGQHIARVLVEEGAYIICTDVRKSISSEALDISDSAAVSEFFKTIKRPIDGIINNAAVSFKGNSIAEEQFDKTLAVNVKGTYNMITCAKQFLSENASIVNLSSLYGSLSPDFRIYENNETLYSSSAYGATKAAVVQLTKYYAVQYAPVRVNSVSPGGIFQAHNDDFNNKYSSRVPMKRMAQPEEIVNTILFLLSPLSSYITGQNIMVDGGLSAW